DPELTRVGYLLHDRDWPDDYASEVGMGDTSHPTGLENFGEALKSATIGYGADERSVSIVESMVHTTFGEYNDDNAEAFSTQDFLPPSLRPDLAEITAHYMGSVHDSFRNEPEGNPTDDYLFDDAELHDPGGGSRALALFLGELGKDPTAQDTVTTASNLWTSHEIGERLEGVEDPGSLTDDVGPIMTVSGKVIGAVDFGAESGIGQEIADADERHNNNVDFAA